MNRGGQRREGDGERRTEKRGGWREADREERGWREADREERRGGEKKRTDIEHSYKYMYSYAVRPSGNPSR